MSPAGIPHQGLPALFARFLRFGLLAWGGPVAQIAMIRRELVDEEHWVTSDEFNRAYAMYQVLPGPEAHELCVHFGTLARGRVGGLVAGLGFMLPGFLLMFALSWAYLRHGLPTGDLAPAFVGVQAGVVALVVNAVRRLGQHALRDRTLLAIAAVSGLTTVAGLHVLVGLALAGLVHDGLVRGRRAVAGVAGAAWILLAAAAWWYAAGAADAVPGAAVAAAEAPSLTRLFGSGLRSGLLTFGGAYTAIPHLQHDAVRVGGWMTDAQFMDGLGLSGILPAPLIIFATFVGYLGAGAAGALVLTAGIFLPAFGFTMLGHELLQRLTANPRIHAFLDGVTAGVIGLIAVTAVDLGRVAITGWPTAVIGAASLALLVAWRARLAVVGVVFLAAAAGWLLRAGV